MATILQQLFIVAVIVGVFVQFGLGLGLIIGGVIGVVDSVWWELDRGEH